MKADINFFSLRSFFYLCVGKRQRKRVVFGCGTLKIEVIGIFLLIFADISYNLLSSFTHQFWRWAHFIKKCKSSSTDKKSSERCVFIFFSTEANICTRHWTAGRTFPEILPASFWTGRHNFLTPLPLLLRHWYETMAFYYVKSILTEISASRQDRRVLQKKQNHQNQTSEHIGHATDI